MHTQLIFSKKSWGALKFWSSFIGLYHMWEELVAWLFSLWAGVGNGNSVQRSHLGRRKLMYIAVFQYYPKLIYFHEVSLLYKHSVWSSNNSRGQIGEILGYFGSWLNVTLSHRGFIIARWRPWSRKVNKTKERQFLSTWQNILQ